MEALILIIVALLATIPQIYILTVSFSEDWLKIEDDYGLISRKARMIFRIIGFVSIVFLVGWLAYSLRIGCKECIEYEEITGPIFKRK